MACGAVGKVVGVQYIVGLSQATQAQSQIRQRNLMGVLPLPLDNNRPYTRTSYGEIVHYIGHANRPLTILPT